MNILGLLYVRNNVVVVDEPFVYVEDSVFELFIDLVGDGVNPNC